MISHLLPGLLIVAGMAQADASDYLTDIAALPPGTAYPETVRPHAAWEWSSPAETPWTWQLLPDGLIWKSYLAGERESRFGSSWLYDTARRSWVWDATLGGRAGIVRFGTTGFVPPEGWQLDIEGASFVRLDFANHRDVESTDFRFGVPLTWSRGPFEAKFAYYHLSSHVGDEYLDRHPDFERRNFSRDAFVIGVGVYPIDSIRLYGEAGWAFLHDGGSRPWEFQFGAEYSPQGPTGLRGTPFAAVNAHLRQEFDFGGSLNVVAGWQWRGMNSGQLFRAGVHYYNGKTSQFSFFDRHDELIGLGIWYDF